MIKIVPQNSGTNKNQLVGGDEKKKAILGVKVRGMVNT